MEWEKHENQNCILANHFPKLLNVKGKAKIVEEQNDKTILTPSEDIPVKGLPEKKDGCGKKEVSLKEAGEFLHII